MHNFWIEIRFATRSTSLLGTSTVSTFAALSDPTIEGTSNLETVTKEETIQYGDVSYAFRNVDGTIITTAQVTINGVATEIILDANEEVSEVTLQKTAYHVKQSTFPRNEYPGPQYSNPGDGGGTTIGTQYHSFNKSGATAVTNVLKGALVSIATLAAYSMGPKGQAAVAGVAASAGEYIDISPRWTTTKLVKYYSNYYGTYFVDQYATIYSDSARTKVSKVVVRYGVKLTGSVIGP